MEERGFEQSLSVFICVYLWLHCMVTASGAGPAFHPGKANPAGAAGPGFAKVQTPTQLRAGEPVAGEGEDPQPVPVQHAHAERL
jgi:hypothetical protein